MNAALASSMLALRDADPSVDVDIEAACPDWQDVLAALDADEASTERVVHRPRRLPMRPRSVRPWRLAILTALIVVAAAVTSIVAWPWSGGGPGSVAYGVTKRSDGAVAVRLSLTHPLPPQDLQAELRAAGISAVVLAESAPGACAEPEPTRIPPNGRVISYPTNIDRAEGFAINPAAIPAGATLVVALVTPGPGGTIPTGSPAYGELFFTLNPPSCIAMQPAGPTSSPIAGPASSPHK